MGIETYGSMVFSSMKQILNLRGNVPLTKPQKEKLARNKAGLRALTKKSVSLKKKKYRRTLSVPHRERYDFLVSR
jgi:hypothetical protein